MIPLYKPYMPAVPKLDEILHSGQLAAGRYTREFEVCLKKYLGTERVAVVNSFNSAISVVITTLGLEHGDEVILSPMACLASTQPYAGEGMKIVWADIDPRTGTMNPESVRAKITPKTKAIVHNHYCGYPGYIAEINQIGREHGITVIDDGIECFGTCYKDQLIGNCGTDVTVFSFNPVRMLTTIDGGAIAFKDQKLYEKSLLVRDCGIDRKKFRDNLGEISPNCDITMQGYSATLSNVNAYVGVCQFEGLDRRMELYQKNAAHWDALLTAESGCTPLKSANGTPNYWVYGMLSMDKQAAIRKFREMGYYASGVHINNNIDSVFGKAETLPGVQAFMDSFVALPCGWWMEDTV